MKQIVVAGEIVEASEDWLVVRPNAPLDLEAKFGKHDFMPYLPGGLVKMKYGEFKKVEKIMPSSVHYVGAAFTVDCDVRINRRTAGYEKSSSITLIPTRIREFNVEGGN